MQSAIARQGARTTHKRARSINSYTKALGTFVAVFIAALPHSHPPSMQPDHVRSQICTPGTLT